MRCKMEEKKTWWALALLLTLFYVGFALADGWKLYPDSESYLTMSLAREPLYPLFLAGVRALFGRGGGERWLLAAVLLQSLLAAFSGWAFVRLSCRRLGFGRVRALVLGGCVLLPSLLCRFLARRHSKYSCAILSEALAMPLYLLFFACLADYVLGGGRRRLVQAALLALLLIGVRKQMLICLPLLMLGLLLRGLREHKLRRKLLASLLLAAALLLGNALIDRAYNLALRGQAVRHTGDARFISTMLLYTAEESDGAAIPDAELRALFAQILRRAEQGKLTRRSAPAGWYGRSLHFMNSYDPIQYDCLRDTVEPWAAAHSETPTATEREIDRFYDGMNTALLPGGLPRLLRVAGDSALMGLVTSVLMMHRLLVWAALPLYAGYVLLLIRSLRRGRRDEAVYALLGLAAILLNTALVSLTIFCQSRYMLYNMPVFYAGLYLLLPGLPGRGREGGGPR